MSGTSGVKKQAKQLLGNNWSRALVLLCLSALVTLFYGFTNMIALYLVSEKNTYIMYFRTGLSFALMVFTVLTLAPLNFGTKRWYYLTANMQDEGLDKVTECYKHPYYWKCAMLRASLYAIIFGWILLIFTPIVVLDCVFGDLTLSIFTFSGIITGPLASAGLVLLLTTILPRYFLAQYIITSKPEMTVRAAIKTSFLYMKDNCGKIVHLYLSFIGWGLLCLLVIPIIFVVPYFEMSLANAAKWIIYEKDREFKL